MAQASEMLDADSAAALDAVTAKELMQEIMAVAERAQGLRGQVAALRKAKKNEEIDRILKRAPVNDLPMFIVQLAQATAGSVLALSRKIEVLTAAVVLDGDIDEDDGSELEELEAVQNEIVKMENLLNFARLHELDFTDATKEAVEYYEKANDERLQDLKKWQASLTEPVTAVIEITNVGEMETPSEEEEEAVVPAPESTAPAPEPVLEVVAPTLEPGVTP